MPDTIHVCKIKWVRGLVEARWDGMAEEGAVNIWRCLEKPFKKEKSATIENIINFALKFQCLLHLCQIHPLGPNPPLPKLGRLASKIRIYKEISRYYCWNKSSYPPQPLPSIAMP